MNGAKPAVSVQITHGHGKGKSFSLVAEHATLGRDPSSDIPIIDEEVSRWHCKLFAMGDELFIEDLQSSNGTFLNGERVSTSSPVVDGDEIRIGQTLLLISTESSELFDSSVKISHETKCLDQEALDTCVMPLSGEVNIASAPGDLEQDAGRRFIRVQNDLRFVYETSLATSRKVDKLKMLEELLTLIFGWVAPDRGCVFLKEPESENFAIRLVKNLSVEKDPGLQVCNSTVDYVKEQKVAVLSVDPQDEVRLATEQDAMAISEIMCVPIQARGQLLGLFYVDTLVNPASKRVRRFTKDHLRLMLAMAHQAAIVIENETNFKSLLEKEKLAAVGETTALLSHQVNNILQGISGGSHLLELGLEKNDLALAKEGWQVVERNQERISQMMLDLVFLSRIYQPVLAVCDLREIVEVVVEKVTRDQAASSLNIRLYWAGNQILCDLDRESIGKAIESLLQLAINASRRSNSQKEFIDLNVNLQDNCVCLDVVYFGAEIYTKLDNQRIEMHDTTRIFGGIEMALCQKWIRGHGGTLQTKTEFGGANRFSVVLPVREK